MNEGGAYTEFFGIGPVVFLMCAHDCGLYWFTMLADEEAKHYRVVERMKKATPGQVRDTKVLSQAKKVFKKMRKDLEAFDFELSEIDAYRKAQDIEKQSREFYLQKADEVEDDRRKGIFKKLAEEENKHYFLLENIIDFVSRPKVWLENAEFYHLDEY